MEFFDWIVLKDMVVVTKFMMRRIIFMSKNDEENDHVLTNY